MRKAFSGIVAGNVKAYGIEQIAQHGPYELRGEANLIQEMDKLLCEFVQQRRMKLGHETYKPCYQLVKG